MQNRTSAQARAHAGWVAGCTRAGCGGGGWVGVVRSLRTGEVGVGTWAMNRSVITCDVHLRFVARSCLASSRARSTSLTTVNWRVDAPNRKLWSMRMGCGLLCTRCSSLRVLQLQAQEHNYAV